MAQNNVIGEIKIFHGKIKNFCGSRKISIFVVCVFIVAAGLLHKCSHTPLNIFVVDSILG